MTKSEPMKYFKTYNGRYAPKDEIRSIKGEYYHMDDLVLLKRKYNRMNNGKVVFDLDTQKWVSTDTVGEKTMISTDSDMIVCSKDGQSIIAYLNRDTIRVRNANMAIIAGARSPRDFDNYIEGGTKNKCKFPFNLAYNFDSGRHNYQYAIENYALKVRNKFSKETTEFLEKLFKRYAIGVEVETSSGCFSKRDLNETRMIPLRDGSIENVELVSPPIRNLNDFTRYSEVYGLEFGISDRGSLHYHISGVPVSKKIGLSIYYLCVRIQDELHNCIPSYKRQHSFLRTKDKDHSKLLQSFGMEYSKEVRVRDHFNKLWRFMTGNRDSEFGEPHPMDGNNKWNFSMRYYYLNMLNYFFKKSKTVEFRLFPPTKSFDLSFIWLLICVAIVQVAEDKVDMVLDNSSKLNLRDVIHLTDFPDNIKNIIFSYIDKASEVNYENVIVESYTFAGYIKSYDKIMKGMSKQLSTLYGE